MTFDGPPADDFTLVLHQVLNKLHIGFGLLIPQEGPNHCHKAVSCCFLCPLELLGEFLALDDLLCLWPGVDANFDVCCRQLREDLLKAADYLSRTAINCFIRPGFKCNE